jgi:hypothetical protein
VTFGDRTVARDRLWIEQGCGPTFVWGSDGGIWTADDALKYEYDAIYEAGPQPLEDWECDALAMPRGTTNAEAHEQLREKWPLKW